MNLYTDKRNYCEVKIKEDVDDIREVGGKTLFFMYLPSKNWSVKLVVDDDEYYLVFFHGEDTIVYKF